MLGRLKGGAHQPSNFHVLMTANRGHHALAAAAAWLSSRPSSAGASRAPRRPPARHTGRPPHDPAWAITATPRCPRASGDGLPCAGRHHRPHDEPHRPRTRPISRADPIMSARPCIPPVVSRGPPGSPQGRPKSENPIAHRLWPAGSCMRGFRTAAGARNPSPTRSFASSDPVPKSSRSPRWAPRRMSDKEPPARWREGRP